MTPQDAQFLKELAKEGVASRGLIGDLKNKVETLKRDVSVWKRKYEKLQEQTKDFKSALKRAPARSKSSYNSCSTPRQRNKSSPKTVICRVARSVT